MTGKGGKSTMALGALEQEAHAWVRRLTSGDATVEDADAFQLWRRQSAAHAIAFAKLDREDRRVPNANERPERCKQHHRWHRELDAGHRVHTASMAYDRAVNHGVERIQGHRDQRGPRIPEQKASDLTGRQLFNLRIR